MERIFRSLEGTWDASVDAAYLPLREIEVGAVVDSIVVDDPRIGGTVVLDIDDRRRVIGIEFVGAASLIGEDLLSGS